MQPKLEGRFSDSIVDRRFYFDEGDIVSIQSLPGGDFISVKERLCFGGDFISWHRPKKSAGRRCVGGEVF